MPPLYGTCSIQRNISKFFVFHPAPNLSRNFHHSVLCFRTHSDSTIHQHPHPLIPAQVTALAPGLLHWLPSTVSASTLVPLPISARMSTGLRPGCSTSKPAPCRRWPKYLEPCHPHGRLRWNYRLLASAWHSPCCYSHLGSESVGERSLSLCLSLSLCQSAFQIQ